MAIATPTRKRNPFSGLEGREALAAYLFLLPWAIGFIAFWAVPILMSLGAAFTQWTLINPPPRWVGLENFRYMFTEDRYFYWSLWVTVKYMLMTLPFSILLGIGLALLLNQKLKGMNLFRTVFYVPAVVSGVAVTILWLNLLDPELGAINSVLRSLGVQDPPGWVNSATWAVPAVAIMSLWGVGGSAIIYLAGLQDLPAHLYEAAEIDGANGWAKFRKITLPLLSPTIFFMLITGLIGAFQVFTPAYILGGASQWGTSKHLRFYVLHTYLKAFQESKLGYGSALAWILVILAAVVVMIIYVNSERHVYYEEGEGAAMEHNLGRIDSRSTAQAVPKLWERASIQSGLHALLIYGLLIGFGALVLLPLSWMVTAALRADGEPVFTIPVAWFPTASFHVENFWRVWSYPSYPLWRPALNSILLVVINVVGVIVSNSLVSYAFARLRFPGREALFRLIILTMLMPGIVLLIPSFLLFHTLGWYGTYLPLTVPSFFGSAFFIFITRQYMRSFPRDLDDAARIDGCSYFGIFRRIILPLSKPVLIVMAVFTFQDVWNDFTGPLIYLNDASKFTLAIALDYFRRSTFSTGVTNTTNLVMAATLLSIIPMLLLYFFAQKQLIGGIASVGLKG